MFLNHLTGVPEAEVVWFLKLAVEPDSGELIGGIDDITRGALANDRLLEPSESATDRVWALIDLVDQLTASHRATLLGQVVLEGPRMERVFSLSQEPQPTPLEAWLAIPSERRQLPIDVEDLPAGAGMALGVEWSHRGAVVLYDAAILGEQRWIGLEFAGVGVLGPFYLDPGVTDGASGELEPQALHTVILGAGPKSTPITIVSWGADTSTSRIPLGQITGPELADLDLAGFLIIDLRDGSVQVVDEQTYLRFIDELGQP